MVGEGQKMVRWSGEVQVSEWQERRHRQVLPAKDPESDHQGESGRETGETELCLLSLLSGVKGVVQCHNTFMDTCLQEDEGRYIGKRI